MTRALLCCAAALALIAAPASAGQAGWTVDFEKDGLKGWHVPLRDQWELAGADGSRVLRLKKDGPIGDPRRPTMFALFEPGCVADFEVEARMRRFGRSLLIAFGFQDRSHFYYAHVSSDDGSHRFHNGVFKVDGGERFRIAGHDSAPALPTKGWHRIRVVRDVESGKIEVYADDDPKPRFDVVDKAFRYGWVGVGSFNETGEFDDFQLKGRKSDKCRPERISPLDP